MADYIDIDPEMTAHPSTGNIIVLEVEDAIKRAVINLVSLNHYEMPYEPIKGGNIIVRQFENFSSMTAFEIKRDIQNVLDNYESRVTLTSVDLNDDSIDENALYITINYEIINSPEEQSVTITLERLR